MLLAIDPGENTGWAVFDVGQLHSCGLGPPSTGPFIELEEVVIECEQLRGRSERNPNAILLMARNAGEWFGRFDGLAKVRYVRVADWKGRTPKDINHRRSFAQLAPPELQALVTGCKGMSPRSSPIDEAVRAGLSKADKRANVLDAIGIGLWAVGRSGKRASLLASVGL